MTWEGRLFSEDETRTLLSRDEGQFLEFKSLWDQEAGHRDRSTGEGSATPSRSTWLRLPTPTAGFFCLGLKTMGAQPDTGTPRRPWPTSSRCLNAACDHR